MLPYGQLWDLDHKLHPTGPKKPKTARQRRRQALLIFLFGVAVMSLFLIPFHFSHLRRLRIRLSLEAAGLLRPTHSPEEVAAAAERGFAKLKALTATPSTLAAYASLSPDRRRALDEAWAATFTFGGSVPAVEEGYASVLAGSGAGVHWRAAAPDAEADGQRNAVFLATLQAQLEGQQSGKGDAVPPFAPWEPSDPSPLFAGDTDDDEGANAAEKHRCLYSVVTRASAAAGSVTRAEEALASARGLGESFPYLQPCRGLQSTAEQLQRAAGVPEVELRRHCVCWAQKPQLAAVSAKLGDDCRASCQAIP